MQIMISDSYFMAFVSFFSVIDGPIDKKQPAKDVELVFFNIFEKLHGIKILFIIPI